MIVIDSHARLDVLKLDLASINRLHAIAHVHMRKLGTTIWFYNYTVFFFFFFFAGTTLLAILFHNGT